METIRAQFEIQSFKNVDHGLGVIGFSQKGQHEFRFNKVDGKKYLAALFPFHRINLCDEQMGCSRIKRRKSVGWYGILPVHRPLDKSIFPGCTYSSQDSRCRRKAAGKGGDISLPGSPGRQKYIFCRTSNTACCYRNHTISAGCSDSVKSSC